jgi:spermidine/putrescine transport system permease protein
MRKALAAWTGIVLAALYLPICVTGVFSFNDSKAMKWSGFTFKWYGEVFRDHNLRDAVEKTFAIAIAATLIATVLGTVAALAARESFRGKKLYNTLVALPVMVPDIVLAIALLTLFHALAIPRSLGTAVAAHVTFDLAYVAIVVSARLQGMDRSVELAARDLGATAWGAFWRVTFPAILPGILSGAVLAFTLSFDDFVITYFTAGTGNTTLPWRVYSLMGRFGVTPEISAVSTLIQVASAALILAAFRIAKVPVTGGGR